MTLGTDKLIAQRQSLEMQISNLGQEKGSIIRDIKVHKDRKRIVLKEIENLEEERNKIASGLNKVKERTENELSKIEERNAEVNELHSKNIAEIGKMREEVTEMEAKVQKDKRTNEKKIASAKSRLKETLTSLLKSLNLMSIDGKNTMDTISAIIQGL